MIRSTTPVECRNGPAPTACVHSPDGDPERGLRGRRRLPPRPTTGSRLALAARRTRRGELAWGLAKGAVEPDETEEEAAVREVLEETGLEAEVESDLGDIRYFYVWEGVRVRKRVHFFLMRATGGDVSDHDTEMEDVRWFSLQAARKRAAYQRRTRGDRACRERPRDAAAGGAGRRGRLRAGILSACSGSAAGSTTPAVNALLGGTSIQAVATPLPVILPTSLVGAFTYAKAGEVHIAAARWAAPPGSAARSPAPCSPSS